MEGVGKQTIAEVIVKQLGFKLLVVNGKALINQVGNEAWSAIISQDCSRSHVTRSSALLAEF